MSCPEKHHRIYSTILSWEDILSNLSKAPSKRRQVWTERTYSNPLTDTQNKNIIPFIITHNPYNPHISQILSKYRVYRINIPATSDNTNNIKQRRRISRLNPYIAITAEEALVMVTDETSTLGRLNRLQVLIDLAITPSASDSTVVTDENTDVANELSAIKVYRVFQN